MRVELNLATQPFGRNRLFWLASGAAGLALVIVATLLVTTYVQNRDLSPDLIRREVQLGGELKELTGTEGQASAVLRDPANEEVLERSLFLNELLYRKGISWTRTFGDLEGVLPPRVMMVQIRPIVTADNNIQLDMRVGSETPQDFIEFLKALESSELFGAASVQGFSPPGENQPLFRYQLSVEYDQQL